jgi:hypothetical protein
MKQNNGTILTELPFKFLQEKIQELETALFFTLSNAVLKMPTHIVKVVHADELGQVWLVIPRPSQYLEEFESEFPVKLDFFKKGKQFFLKLEGKAFIETNMDEMINFKEKDQEIIAILNSKQSVIIKVKIQNADYFEVMEKPSASWLKNSKTLLYNWFLNPQPPERCQQFIPIPLPTYRNSSKINTGVF